MNNKTDCPSLQCEAVARAALGESARRTGGELVWRCPNHDDQHPSLKVSPRKNAWMCGPCDSGGNAWELAVFLAFNKNPCKWELLSEGDKRDVASWLRECGVLPGHGKTSRKAAKAEPCGEKLREHVYTSEHGEPLANKIRWGSHDPEEDKSLKHFSWQRWEGGNWLNGLDAHKQGALPLYRIDKISDRLEGEPLILCEGEHDADAGAAVGLATTTSGGTGTFPARHAEWFRGRDVVIVAHADEPGRLEAQKRAAMLYGKAVRVRVVEMPTMTPALKDLAEAIDRGLTRDSLLALFDDAPEWKPRSGADILDETYRFVRRYVFLAESQAVVVTLWITHTHAFESATSTPYLHVYSPAEGCGKSQLLEVLEALASRAILVSGGQPAYFRRVIAEQPPATLLLDEVDNLFKGNPEMVSQINSFINSGYRKSGHWGQCEKVNGSWEGVRTPTFCPKVIAGIASRNIETTIRSRAIPIRLDRLVGKVDDWDNEEDRKAASPIAAKLAAWCEANKNTLAAVPRVTLTELNNRQKQIARPLFAIANLAGADWPERAKNAIIELCRKAQSDAVTLQVKLIEDLLDIFYPQDEDGEPLESLEAVRSETLATRLAQMVGRPWAQMPRSHKPITQQEIASLLRLFEERDEQGKAVPIEPKNVRCPGEPQGKGYKRQQFIDAWRRYCPELRARHDPHADIEPARYSDIRPPAVPTAVPTI